jgi:hypothetical protein
LEVVAHTCLSAKHTLYVVRAGRRMLVVGTGAQGPPALLGEWIETPAPEPSPSIVEPPANSQFIVRIGDVA